MLLPISETRGGFCREENTVDVNKAVIAHRAWKEKLATYIAHPDHSLNSVEAGANDRCELGQWIKKEAGKFAGNAEFIKLNGEHTRFHRAAADVIRRADTEHVGEEIALGAKSEFGAASAAVVSAIMAMKDKF
jgi:hypothetical protein